MISIIICSRKSDISDLLKENINKTIGVNYEIVVIDNSNNDYSIFSAYNKGFSQSKYPYLCFVHEDVLFQTLDWGKKLINHLVDKKTGIIGVAGGKMMTKVPAPSWNIGEKNMHILKHINNRKNNKPIHIKLPNEFYGTKKNALLLDGVFLGMRSDLFDIIKFDESFTGFHGYDLDISTQATVSGFNNFVVYDILLEHFSAKNGNYQYYINLLKLYKKWEKHLPLFCNNISVEILSSIDKIQLNNLAKLTRRLARTGFKTNEIIEIISYYVAIINTKEARKLLNFIHLKIAFEKIFNSQINRQKFFQKEHYLF